MHGIISLSPDDLSLGVQEFPLVMWLGKVVNQAGGRSKPYFHEGWYGPWRMVSKRRFRILSKHHLFQVNHVNWVVVSNELKYVFVFVPKIGGRFPFWRAYCFLDWLKPPTGWRGVVWMRKTINKPPPPLSSTVLHLKVQKIFTRFTRFEVTNPPPNFSRHLSPTRTTIWIPNWWFFGLSVSPLLFSVSILNCGKSLKITTSPYQKSAAGGNLEATLPKWRNNSWNVKLQVPEAKRNTLQGTNVFFLLVVGGFKYFYFHPYLGKWSNLTSIFLKWVETAN